MRIFPPLPQTLVKTQLRAALMLPIFLICLCSGTLMGQLSVDANSRASTDRRRSSYAEHVSYQLVGNGSQGISKVGSPHI